MSATLFIADLFPTADLAIDTLSLFKVALRSLKNPRLLGENLQNRSPSEDVIFERRDTPIFIVGQNAAVFLGFDKPFRLSKQHQLGAGTPFANHHTKLQTCKETSTLRFIFVTFI